jgi:hypothetical protein
VSPLLSGSHVSGGRVWAGSCSSPSRWSSRWAS